MTKGAAIPHLSARKRAFRKLLQGTLAFVLLSLPVAPLVLQAAPLRLSEYQKQEWQVEDGLPENQIRAITQLPSGQLLLATSGGVATFDGISFHPYKVGTESLLTNEAINALLVRRNGELWLGTDGQGVLRQKKDRLVRLSEHQGSRSERIRAMYEDTQGAIWLATQNGIIRVHATDTDEQLEILSSAGPVSGDIIQPFAEDGSGGMFFATSSGVFHWVQGTVTRFWPKEANSMAALSLLDDHSGHLWVGTRDGLLQLNLSQDSYSNVVRSGVSGQVNNLLEDPQGNLWAGTRTAGLWRVSAGKPEHWNYTEGLSDHYVRCMYRDREGSLWIGTLTGGLARWRIPPLIPFGTPEGLPDVFTANLLGDKRGDLWIGTWGKGLYRLHDGVVRQEPLPDRAIIRALTETPEGDIWIGTWFDGLFRYRAGRFEHFLLGTESITNAISSVQVDPKGGLWVGTYQGIEHFPGGVPDKAQKKLFLPGKLITCFAVDQDGDVFAGTSNGLYRIRNGETAEVQGISHPYIYSVSLDDAGDLWVGTKAGGIDYVQETQAKHIPSLQGLVDYPVFSVLDDHRGFLWLSTTRGLLRVLRSQLQEVSAGRRKMVDSILLGKADGMRSSQCVGAAQPPATRMKDGSLWFATAKGFVHTNAEATLIPSSPPKPFIPAVFFADTQHEVSRAAEVPAGTEDVRIPFDALQLSNPYQLEFRYKLAGYDRDWTMTRARFAHYRQLPPGFYRFAVQVRTAGGNWSSETATLALRQAPYFYETWWFCGLLLWLATVVVVKIFSWRVKLAKDKLSIILAERNRIASDWHDSLMAGFAAISWQLESTSNLLKDENSAAAKACNLARTMVKHCQAEARRIIWDLRADHEATGNLSTALSQTIGTLGAREGIAIKLNVEGEEVPLAPDYVHHLSCIVQEAMTNALRHADPRQILVQLSYAEESVAICVKDDGRGMQQAGKPPHLNGHFGIPVMEERARKLGGVLNVTSAQGKGTEIYVKIPCRAVEVRA